MGERNKITIDFELEDGSGVAGHSLRGEVDKILFKNEEGTYTVLQLRDAAGMTHTVVGALPDVSAGQGLCVTGRWETHKDYGRQLRIDTYETQLPTTTEGLIRYLASGIVKGLGEKNARAIVKAFGADTANVIENAPKRLLEVPGLGKKRIEALSKIWKENAAKRELQIHFQGYGISPAYFKRIVNTYGEKSAEMLHRDPYKLARDVDGIGFRMADAIAGKMGIGGTDPRRMLAGVAYALNQMRGLGHVCMPRDYFIDYCANLLGTERDAAEQALESAAKFERALIRKSVSGEEMVYDPEMYDAEMILPECLKNLLNAPEFKGALMAGIPALQDSEFSSEQLRGVELAAQSAVSIITGGPGVGKTTVVSEIVRRAGIARLRIALAAPTGRAAKRMTETTRTEAFTIHRLLKWDPINHKFVYNEEIQLPCDLLIVDEASMLDLPLAAALFKALAPGTSLVIVGDSDQLPSVGPGTVLNDLIACRKIPVTRLTKIFRQGPGSGIIHAAHAVNAGTIPQPTRKGAPLTDFYWIEKDDPESAAEIIEKLVCERIPQRFGLNPMSDIQVLSPMNKGICGTQAVNTLLQKRLNGETKQRFTANEKLWFLGDKVMQTSNNYDKSVYNGDMGRIVGIHHDTKKFTVAFDTLYVDYDFAEADQLTLSYAVTIHKSQGSEFPAVVMPLLSQHFMMLQRNLLYTGITRAKRLMILVGSYKAVSMAVNNVVSEPRYSLLQERLVKNCQIQKIKTIS